ncbi:MAG: trypsin-like peptidase domain-containing protein [Piscinibacter sp.]|nr:trypsin-like peptidase domain-containing protein [Piscinibacter sp.]
MNQSVSGSSKPGWKRWALIGGVLLLLLLLALGWWWWWQSRQAAAVGDQRARLQAALERQKALTDELAKAAPAGPTDCPPGQSLQPIGGAGGGAGAGVPPAMAGSAPVTAMPPLPAGGEAAALGGSALAQRLEQATAIVIVAGPNDMGTGTGFFIAPNLLVTNRHVVEHSQGKRLFLTSKALGSLRRATVLSATPSSVPGSPDFALLRMDEGSAAGTLDMALEVGKLANVVAAGYPGVVLQGDSSFQRLLKGDFSSAPDLNLTQGAVQSLQTGQGGMPLIVHTASIAKGNSGGPLVDGCGRVVGINTFINVDQSQSAKINYAIRSQVMASFLQSAGTSARNDPRPCAAKG